MTRYFTRGSRTASGADPSARAWRKDSPVKAPGRMSQGTRWKVQGHPTRMEATEGVVKGFGVTWSQRAEAGD